MLFHNVMLFYYRKGQKRCSNIQKDTRVVCEDIAIVELRVLFVSGSVGLEVEIWIWKIEKVPADDD